MSILTRSRPAAPLAVAAALALATACAPEGGAQESAGMASPMPLATPDPQVYIVNLSDGQTVSSPVRVIFGLSGMGVAPAGVEHENTGHHHLLIDTTEVTPGAPLPAIPGEVVHFGGGQTETVIELESGAHTLMLELADMNHVPFDPPVESAPITVTVE